MNASRRNERTQREMKMIIPDRGGRLEEGRAEMPQWTSRQENAKQMNPNKGTEQQGKVKPKKKK